jgi:hypothetical protein
MKKSRMIKPTDKKESEPVTLKITSKELAILKKRQERLIPLGALIKHYLRTKIDLLRLMLVSDKKDLQQALGIQLELFQSTKKLNLSETYEAIPKEVSANNSLIKWLVSV